jgi:GNAT superfamily N-acetyltransferase
VADSEVVIRALEPGDSMAELTELLHRAYRHLADLGLRYIATWQSEEITHRRATAGSCFVAVCAGRLAGTIVLEASTPSGSNAWYRRPEVMTFHQFGVLPELQGRGIGSALLERVRLEALRAGARELALDTAEPATHLIALYRRLGYRTVDRATGPDVNYRSVIMSRYLHTGARGGAVELQPARAEHVGWLADMNARLIEDERHDNPMDRDGLAARMAGWLERDDYRADLLLCAGDLVGYALHRASPHPHLAGRTLVEVRQLYVERERRRLGIGRLAMDALRRERFAARSVVRIDVLERNPAARAFWESIGFAPRARTLELDAEH